MKPPLGRVIWAAGLACLIGPHSLLAAPTGDPGRVEAAACFRTDKRLNTPITVSETNRPLGEWLRALGARLNLRLSASREAADHKVTLYLERRPAAEVLSLVANHLSFEWTGDSDGYTLLEGDRTRQASDQRRRAQWAATLAWMKRLSELAELPASRRATRQAEVEAALAGGELAPAARAGYLEEQSLFQDLRRHTTAVPLMIKVFRSLTSAQLEQLRTNRFLRLSSAYDGLTPETAGVVHELLGNQGIPPPPNTPRVAELCFLLEEVARNVEHPNGARQLRLRAELLAALPGRSSTSVNWRLRTPPVGDPASPSIPKDDPDFNRTIDMNWPPARLPLELAVAGPAAYTLKEWKIGLVTVAQVSEAIHAQTGLDLLADSFVRARIDPSKLHGKKTLVQILGVLETEVDFTWRKAGNVLSLQSKTRVYDRDAEVPDRVIRPFKTRVVQQAAPTLDDLARLAGSLTDSQCRGITDCWGWYFEGDNLPAPWVSGGVYEARYHLRLWDSLTAAQRKSALAEKLSGDTMSAGQRKLCGLALSAPGDDLIRPDTHLIPTLGSLSRLSVLFSLRHRDVESQTYRDDEGAETADITTVGQSGADDFNRLRFGGRPRIAVGPRLRMHAFDFIYEVTDGTAPLHVARSTNLHLVPRWPLAPTP